MIYKKLLEQEGVYGLVDWCVDAWRGGTEDPGTLKTALEYMIRLKYQEDWGYSAEFVNNGILKE